MTDVQRTNTKQPIAKYEMQRAKDRAMEMAREKHKSFGVDLLFLGVEAAFDYCEALTEAREELWRGELDYWKGLWAKAGNSVIGLQAEVERLRLLLRSEGFTDAAIDQMVREVS